MEYPWKPLHHLATWPVRSVEQARRNALVASTALASRRRERDDVEEFLERYLADRSAMTGPRSA